MIALVTAHIDHIVKCTQQGTKSNNYTEARTEDRWEQVHTLYTTHKYWTLHNQHSTPKLHTLFSTPETVQDTLLFSVQPPPEVLPHQPSLQTSATRQRLLWPQKSVHCTLKTLYFGPSDLYCFLYIVDSLQCTLCCTRVWTRNTKSLSRAPILKKENISSPSMFWPHPFRGFQQTLLWSGKWTALCCNTRV